MAAYPVSGFLAAWLRYGQGVGRRNIGLVKSEPGEEFLFHIMVVSITQLYKTLSLTDLFIIIEGKFLRV